MSKILGISGSLRNARRGFGNISLIDEIMSLKDEDSLFKFLEQEALTHLANFKEAGRTDELPFDAIYRNLKKLKGNRGLSNSEVALTSALWSAKEIGCEIEHMSLAEYFPEGRGLVNEEELRQKLIDADAFIISTPVYFGDRGSLTQSLISYIRSDEELKKKLEGKVYAGIAVGAKRNGGQETTLIYQMLDMINLGLFAVGNDSETTSQYGGTGLAGDIGTMSQDAYGLKTSMGTGRRIARVAIMLEQGQKHVLNDKVKLAFWLLQDKYGIGKKAIIDMVSPFADQVDLKIIEFDSKNIVRCLACDICPTHIDVDEEYRCIIKSTKDDLKDIHEELLDADALIPVVYSPVDRKGLQSNYQRLMERTRYIRRGDYVFSDLLAAPMVIEDIGASENMQIRMMTSIVRHHTVLSKPLKLYRYEGKEVNMPELKSDFAQFIARARQVLVSKLLAYSSGVNHLKYNPVGYVLSSVKDAEDIKLQKRREMVESRIKKNKKLTQERVVKDESSEN